MSVSWIQQFVSSNVSILKATTPALAGKVTRWTRTKFVKVTFQNVIFAQSMTYIAFITFACFTSDVDECSNVNDCQQECENVPGSYNCSCYEGFALSSDGKGCNGWLLLLSADNIPYLPISLPIALTECSDSNDCSHICAMVDGTPTCFCNLGYELAVGSDVQCVGRLKYIVT